MSVRRYDRGTYSQPVKTPEGWLRVDGRLTRTGVFRYRNADGSERRELRLPEEVFKPESLASFRQVPVTDDHPAEWVTAKNFRQHARGSVGENIRQDGEFVAATLLVADEELLAKAENGDARELSCGYTCDLEAKPGVHQGEAYDFIQRNIRGNHVAIVPVGRAGPEARLRMDAGDAAMVIPADRAGGNPPIPEEQPVSLKKKRIDGIDVEMTEQAVQAVEVLERKHADALEAKQKELAELQKKLDATTKDREATQAKLDAALEDAKKKDEALKAAQDPKALRERIDARAKLETVARNVLGKKEKLDGLDDAALRLAVVKKAHPERKFDGKSAEYVQAAFDLVAEKHADADDSDDDLASARRSQESRGRADRTEDREDGDDQDDDERRVDAEESRKKMLRNYQNAHLPKKKAS